MNGIKSRRSASVVIYGPSGIGKSALVQHFIDRRIAGQRALVLRSRCHEHEAIPYKGLDGVIDALVRYLMALPSADLTRAMPADVTALARLFPVMRALGLEPDPSQNVDPISLRYRAFSAFRDLLGRVAERQPVVVDIDDFPLGGCRQHQVAHRPAASPHTSLAAGSGVVSE